MHLNKPVVGMAATPDGGGYWLVAADGGIFSYGDATFYGSTGSMVLNKPIIGMITGPAGAGYFLVASDGGIFSFGTAPFYGSLGGLPIKHPIVAAAATPTDNGYWFTDTAGLVSNFGSADYYGSAPPNLFRPIVGMAEAPGSTGAFFGGTYPSGSYGYDISKFQCNSFPAGDHQIGIVQVDGCSSGNTNPCLAAGAGLGRRRAQPLHLLDLRDVGHQRAGLQRRHVLQRRLPGRDQRLQRRRQRRSRLHRRAVVARRRERPAHRPGRRTPRRTRSSSRAR